MAYRAVLTIVFGVHLAAGADRDPANVLKRITARVAAAVEHAPNYTCVEVVTRDYFRPAAVTLPRACNLVLEERRHPGPAMVLRPIMSDRLRMDVALVQTGEIFSWVGASKFDDRGIDALVRSGPIGTGAFAGFVSVVFNQDVKTFTFQQDVIVNGRRLMEYSFQVPLADSHYKIKLGNSWGFVPYTGTVRIDPLAEEVVEITLLMTDMPPAANSCLTTTTVEFGKARLGDIDFPLPARTRQRFVLPSGEETVNHTTLSQCREYIGESTIRYDSSPAVAGTAAASGPSMSAGLPPGLRFNLELTAPIEVDTAAAGDPFAARLVETLHIDKRTMARAGSLVTGRLLRVQQFHAAPQESILVLKPESLDIGGSPVPLTAFRDWTRLIAGARGSKKTGIKILLPLRGEEFAGVFQLPTEHGVLKKGFRSDWRTAAPAPRNRLTQ